MIQKTLLGLVEWLPSAAGGVVVCVLLGANQVDAQEAPTITLRIMSSNLTSGNYQRYEGPGIRLMQGISPDIVMIQEFNYGDDSPEDIQTFVSETFGDEFSYYREGESSIPNGVVSRYPIVESGEWNDTYASNRDYAWARIDIPGSRDLWVVSLHFLTSDGSSRNKEAQELVNHIKSAGIPSEDYLVIGGDLNTSSRTEACITTLSQLVGTAAPYPEDQLKNSNTNTSRSKPYDWVMVDRDLAALQQPTRFGNSVYPSGIVLDSRVYTPLSEVSPVQFGDSDADNMQHMGVAKDFLITDDEYFQPGPSLMISEIMYTPSSGPEWVEVYNYGRQEMSLRDIMITDNEGTDLNESEFWFADDDVIAPGEFLVLGEAQLDHIDIYWRGINLGNLSDNITIVMDERGYGMFSALDILESVEYRWDWGGYGTGRSLSRVSISNDPHLASSWTSSSSVGGTPGEPNDTW